MNSAFSTSIWPTWDFETLAAKAKEFGYDGIEIVGPLNESGDAASNIFLTDRKKLSATLQAQGLQICCLASSIAMTTGRTATVRSANAKAADEVRLFIDAATEMNCPLVKILDTQVQPRQNREAAALALGDWLIPLGDYAADRGVGIVVENRLSFRSARAMWGVLDRINHPSIACCWNVVTAAEIGESPFVSVPMLNGRIAHAHVADATFSANGADYCNLGDGRVPVRSFLMRLLGIGYGGWVTFDRRQALQSNLAELEQVLPQAIAKLREWTTPPKPLARAVKKAVVTH